MEDKERKKSRLYRSMYSASRSASRIIRLHNFFSKVPQEEQASLKSILKRELRIIFLRILRLYGNLMINVKKTDSSDLSVEAHNMSLRGTK